MRRLNLQSIIKNSVIAREILENFSRKIGIGREQMGKNLFLAALGEFQILKKTPPPLLYFLGYKKGGTRPRELSILQPPMSPT